MNGKIFDDYITGNHISKKDIANEIGITCADLDEILKSDDALDCTTYYKLCKALSLPLEYLLEGGC